MPRNAATTAAVSAGTNYPVIKDKALIAAAEEYFTLARDESRIALRKKELKPQLLAAMAGAPKAYAGARLLSASEVATIPAMPDREITKAMLGQVLPGSKGRAGYTQISIT